MHQFVNNNEQIIIRYLGQHVAGILTPGVRRE